MEPDQQHQHNLGVVRNADSQAEASPADSVSENKAQEPVFLTSLPGDSQAY